MVSRYGEVIRAAKERIRCPMMLSHNPGPDTAEVTIPSPTDSSFLSSPSFSPSDEDDEHPKRCLSPSLLVYIHSPPHASAVPARSILVPRNKRKFDGMLDTDGNALDPAACKQLVDGKVDCGEWRLVMSESFRCSATKLARSYIMEFIVAGSEGIEAREKEIKVAGYEHYSLCSMHGWQPFDLPMWAKSGWGRVVTDYERLADWHAERSFSIPMPHHAGDGWVCRAQHWSRANYPGANEYGPFGNNGPRWTSIA